MRSSGIIIIIIVAVVLLIGFYSLSTGSGEEGYKTGLVEERVQKDKFMRTSDESPFAKDRNSFTALKYFEPDPSYRVIADLMPIEYKKVVVLPTSSGEQNSYLEYGWAEFEWGGAKNRLLILEIMSMGPTRGTLFLAFADETSAGETYGAGRYLDLKKQPGAGSLVLDFNKAYNPYCAYNDNFSCPFPPKENILKISIRAGEKTYH